LNGKSARQTSRRRRRRRTKGSEEDLSYRIVINHRTLSVRRGNNGEKNTFLIRRRVRKK
jgi:hypothetical protein